MSSFLDSDKRISAGNLAICKYHAENFRGQSFIALMKIDPSDGLIPKTITDEEGQNYNTYEIVEDVMPSTKERLQKCAFIRSLEPRGEDYDLMLLDEQTSGIAKFFTEFLDVELALDDRDRTHLFYQKANEVKNELRAKLTIEQNDSLTIAFESAIRQQKVNVDYLVESLDLDEEQKNVVKTKFSDLDKEFSIDRNYVEKLPDRIQFIGDYGLKISFNSKDKERVIKSVIPPTDENLYWQIVIHTRTWKEEVKK